MWRTDGKELLHLKCQTSDWGGSEFDISIVRHKLSNLKVFTILLLIQTLFRRKGSTESIEAGQSLLRQYRVNVPLTMQVEARLILTLIVIIRNEGYAQMLENINLQQENIPREPCTSMMISYSTESKGEQVQKF